MKKIFLVRHCLADGQHKDSPLTHSGVNQAYHLDYFFSKQKMTFDKIVTSPYLRSIDSIKPFAEKINQTINIDENLSERILSCEPIDDWIAALEQSFHDYNFSLPGGETAKHALNRGNQVLNDLMSDKNVTNAIVVSHGNLISLLLSQFDSRFGFDTWCSLRNPDVYLLHIDKQFKTAECVW